MKRILIIFGVILALFTLVGCKTAETPQPPTPPADNRSDPTPASPSTQETPQTLGAPKVLETELFRVRDMANSETFLDLFELEHLIVTPDTVVPSYINEIDEFFFPVELTREDVSREEGYEIPFDLDGVTDYTSLVEKVRTEISTVSDDLLDSFVLLRAYTQNDLDADAVMGRITWFHFGASAYGIPINYQADGYIPTAFYDEESGVLRFYDVDVFSFESADNRAIQAIPLAEALKIAESTRTTKNTVVLAQLVYIYNAEELHGTGANYRLCWQIDANQVDAPYVTYYVDCETGEYWYPTKSEE